MANKEVIRKNKNSLEKPKRLNNNINIFSFIQIFHSNISKIKIIYIRIFVLKRKT